MRDSAKPTSTTFSGYKSVRLRAFVALGPDEKELRVRNEARDKARAETPDREPAVSPTALTQLEQNALG